MIAEILYTEGAARDVENARRWYNGRREGLGDEFLLALRDCTDTIRQTPELFAKLEGEYRGVLLKRFPYAVYYTAEQQRVVVDAVFHTARDPRAVSDRLG